MNNKEKTTNQKIDCINNTITEPNEFIKNKKLKKWLPFIISFCSTFIIFLIIGICNGFVYFINDDKSMMEILSGKYINHSSHYGVYLSQIICYPLKLLYQAMPNIPFHGLTLIFFISISILIIGTCIINVKDKKSLIFSLILFFGLIFLPMLYHIINIQFTTTAIFPIFAFMVLLAKYPKDATKSKKILYFILLFILATYSCAIRDSVFEVSLFFIVFVLIFNLIKHKQKWTSALLVVAICLTSFGLNVIVNNAVLKNDVEYQKYIEFNKVRSDIYDHYGFPDYQEAKDFYDSIGMSEDCVYLLANGYALELEEFSLDNMKAIIEYQKQHKNTKLEILNAFNTSITRYFGWQNIIETLSIALLILFLIFGCERKGKFSYIYLGVLVVVNLILSFLISYIMKFPARVCSCLTFGIIGSLLPLWFDLSPKKHILNTDKKYKTILNSVFKYTFLSAILIIFTYSFTTTLIQYTVKESFCKEKHNVEQFIQSHTDDIFILTNGVTENQTEFALNKPIKITNAYNSLSWNTHSPYNKEYINNLGYENYQDMIKNCDHLKYIFKSNDEMNHYKNYLEERYNKTLIFETTIPNYEDITVYIVANC